MPNNVDSSHEPAEAVKPAGPIGPSASSKEIGPTEPTAAFGSAASVAPDAAEGHATTPLSPGASIAGAHAPMQVPLHSLMIDAMQGDGAAPVEGRHGDLACQDGGSADLFYIGNTAPLVAARTDSELASAFLESRALSSHSLKSTRKDLGRFLLWCRQEQKMLMQLSVEDLATYKAFLLDPQPSERWISVTKWPRADLRWRPFSGPLSLLSANHAFRVVKALLEFAKDAGYLARNAGALVRNLKTVREARVTRYLGSAAIDFVAVALEAYPHATPAARKARARDRFLFLTYLTTGARLSEITGATMGAFYAEDDHRWWLDVLGKGNKKRRLPVSQDLLTAFRHYRVQFGLSVQTGRDDATPLVLATRGTDLVGVTDEAVSKALKTLFAAAAEIAAAEGDADAASALRTASVHWLRHTMLTTHANNNVSLKVLQDTAGHANLSTTALYLHKSDKERHDEILASLNRDNSKQAG